MPYVTGTANSFADVLTALRNACTANGYTLSGNVLHKGTLYAETLVGAPLNDGAGTPPATGALLLRVGNGIDGGNLLTTPAPATVRIGRLCDASGTNWPDWDWPVTYHIHIHAAPDEVLMMVNYDGGTRWQHYFFGQSPVPGNAGSGNWQSCLTGGAAISDVKTNQICIAPDGGRMGFGASGGSSCPAPFWWGNDSVAIISTEIGNGSHIHGAIDDVTGLPEWSNTNRRFNSGGVNLSVSAAAAAVPLFGYSPNAWNNEPHLIPIQVLQVRPSSKSSLVGELRHVRMCRNNFIDDGTVITLGPDQWKVYPCHKKNVSVPNGGAPIDHSGTIAMAIRYDGP